MTVLGFSENVTVASIAAFAVVLAALIGTANTLFQKWFLNTQTSELKHELDTGNGHTAGESLGRMEDLHRESVRRLDRLEVGLAEHAAAGDEKWAEIRVDLVALAAKIDEKGEA
jgi:hypothetical protein